MVVNGDRHRVQFVPRGERQGKGQGKEREKKERHLIQENYLVRSCAGAAYASIGDRSVRDRARVAFFWVGQGVFNYCDYWTISLTVLGCR